MLKASSTKLPDEFSLTLKGPEASKTTTLIGPVCKHSDALS